MRKIAYSIAARFLISGFQRPASNYARVLSMVLDCSELIENKLWVGSFVEPEEVAQLERMKITAILSLQSDEDLLMYNISVPKLQSACVRAEIQLRRFPIPDFDREALLTHLPDAVEGLEEALAPHSARVYLHCTAGINRGPTLAAAYLIKNHGLSAERAYDYVTNRRHCSPYAGILKEYEISLRQVQTE